MLKIYNKIIYIIGNTPHGSLYILFTVMDAGNPT